MLQIVCTPSSDLLHPEFVVSGTESQSEVMAAVRRKTAVAVITEDGCFYRRDISIEQTGYTIWRAKVRYENATE